MPNLSSYKKMLQSYGSTEGEARKAHSDMIMDATWRGDIQSRVCYLYDYYHDDEPKINYRLSSATSSKIPIDTKFIINSYNTLNKDQVAYHIQFRPHQECNVPYYEEYERKYGAEFPIGLYIDIPDNKNIFRRWLIVDRANTYDPQFITWAVVPCDYRFNWVKDNIKYKMWGVSRSQNSYNSGVWADYKTESVENQRKCILPLNSISETLFYNQRLIISAPITTPITWKITKVENTSPLGINHITFAQDKFDQHKDFIEKDEFGNVIGMWADYYENNLPKDAVPSEIIEKYMEKAEITYSGVKPEIKVGGSYKTFTCTYYDDNHKPVEKEAYVWNFSIDGKPISLSPDGKGRPASRT